MKKIKNKNKADRCQYRCQPRGLAKSIRYGSVFDASKLSLIELARLIFHFFIDGYTIEEIIEKESLIYLFI